MQTPQKTATGSVAVAGATPLVPPATPPIVIKAKTDSLTGKPLHAVKVAVGNPANEV